MAKKEVLNNDALTLRVNEGPMETVLDVAEQAIDATEQALDILENQVERVVTVTKNNPLVIIGVALVAAGVAGVVAYKIAEKRTTLKYEDILAREIDAAKAFYKRVNKEGEFSTPESAVEALVPGEVVEAINSYQGKDHATPYNRPQDIVVAEEVPPTVVVEETTIVQHNVFQASRTDPRDWDPDQELLERDTTKPYVISFDEFNLGEEGHEQATLAYYEADDTLADEKDGPLDNPDYTIGEDNLLRFGHGSNDRNVVYVRNERLGIDFEVIRTRGSFAKDVLGLDPEPEIRHSHRRPNRRSWRTDE